MGPFTKTWNGADVTGSLLVHDDSLIFGPTPLDALYFELDQFNSFGFIIHDEDFRSHAQCNIMPGDGRQCRSCDNHVTVG